MTVAKSTPNANEIAIGTIKNVAGVGVAINGTRPIKVVIDVRKIGLNLATPALAMAFFNEWPNVTSLLM